MEETENQSNAMEEMENQINATEEMENQSNAMEEMDNPFYIFPEEVWEAIFEEVDDCENLLKAFPQLSTAIRGNPCYWRIGEIIPLLFPKLISFKDFMNCRHVSRRWKRAVDNCFESHADQEPYNCSLSPKIPQTHFNYRRMPFIFPFEIYASAKLYNVPTEMEERTDYNPFAGRNLLVTHEIRDEKFLYLKFPTTAGINCPELRALRCLTARIFPFLQAFGHHVRHITFKLDLCDNWYIERECLGDFMKLVVECLQHLPNLKSLTFVADGSDKGYPNKTIKNIAENLSKSSLPARLNALDLYSFGKSYRKLFDPFLKLFINHSNIRKLTIYPGSWNTSLTSLLPNLSELCLVEHSSAEPKHSLKNILKQLVNFPVLKKLALLQFSLNLNDLLDLNSAPGIHALELEGEVFVRSFRSIVNSILGKQSFKYNSFPNICILKMTPIYITGLEFSSFFPSLRVLYLFMYTNRSVPTEKEEIFSKCVYRILKYKTLELEHFQSLWETYPNLQMITVEIWDSNEMYQLVREHPAKLFTSCNKQYSVENSPQPSVVNQDNI